jgi:arsenate reductase
MATRLKILFVCIHNSARSQMAEAFMNQYGGDLFEAESAGLEPGTLNPLAVEVMKEEGIDISRNAVKDAFEFVKQGRRFTYVVTVCDEAAAERCPIFPGVVQRLHWSFPDPSTFTGSHEERLARTRGVRDQIKQRVLAFTQEQR